MARSREVPLGDTDGERASDINSGELYVYQSFQYSESLIARLVPSLCHFTIIV